MISCTLDSVAGVLITLNYTLVSPHAMDPNSNLDILFGSLLGGAGNVYGAIVGGILYAVPGDLSMAEVSPSERSVGWPASERISTCQWCPGSPCAGNHSGAGTWVLRRCIVHERG